MLAQSRSLSYENAASLRHSFVARIPYPRRQYVVEGGGVGHDASVGSALTQGGGTPGYTRPWLTRFVKRRTTAGHTDLLERDTHAHRERLRLHSTETKASRPPK